MLVENLVREGAVHIAKSGSDTATLDAQLLLASVLGKDRTWLFTWSDASVSGPHRETFRALVDRRSAGEPIAHILGYREFWSLELYCNSSTLIPRPETEHLVEQALQLPIPDNASVLDLGAGTGAIALALASERPGWSVCGVDFSHEAVALAKRNNEKVGLSVPFVQSDWFDVFTETDQFDLIVSNPPYVDPVSPWLGERDVRFEPESALIAANAGMADIEHIVFTAQTYLNRSGWLALEHGFDQQEPAQQCFLDAGYSEVNTVLDLAGLPRVTLGKTIV